MSSSVSQHTAIDVLRERAIGMLTAGMSTRAVAREFDVNIYTIHVIFREFGSTSNWPYNYRSRVTTHLRVV